MAMIRKNDALVALLRAKPAKPAGFNKAVQLRPWIDEIESAQARGVSRKSICEALAEAGIEMSLSTLDSILHRHRKKHGKAKKNRSGRKENAVRKTTPVFPSTVKTVSQGTADPAAVPKTGMDRLNEIMRSTPDLAELARLAKSTRKDKI